MNTTLKLSMNQALLQLTLIGLSFNSVVADTNHNQVSQDPDLTTQVSIAQQAQSDTDLRTTLPRQALADLKDWAVNPKMTIQRVLKKLDRKTKLEQKEALESVIESVVSDTQKVLAQQFMKKALKRALFLSNIIGEESVLTSGTIDTQVSFLRELVIASLEYYQGQYEYLGQAITPSTDYSKLAYHTTSFGIKFSKKVDELARGIDDASAEFKVLHTQTSWLMVDINLSQQRTAMSPVIVNLNDELKEIASESQGVIDSRYVQFTRDLKALLRDSQAEVNTIETELNALLVRK